MKFIYHDLIRQVEKRLKRGNNNLIKYQVLILKIEKTIQSMD
jgi:hypothetical protein